MFWLQQSVGPGPRGNLESSNISIVVKLIAMSYSRFTALQYSTTLSLSLFISPIAPFCIRIIALLYRMTRSRLRSDSFPSAQEPISLPLPLPEPVQKLKLLNPRRVR
jgi:hypothetical protein